MPKFRTKPVVIEAFQFHRDVWEGEGDRDSPAWLEKALHSGIVRIAYNDSDLWFDILTLEGTMKASDGDWIIRGVHGEIYPCKPDIFVATYDAVEK